MPNKRSLKKEAILRNPRRALMLIGLVLILLTLSSCTANGGDVPTITPPIVPEPSFTPEPTVTLTATSEPTTTQIPTIEPTATSTPIPAFPFDYQIQTGDSLGLIAERFNVPIALIILENNISNPDLIIVGQMLRIPDPASKPAIISSTNKEILVILSLQKAYAYENGYLQREFTVSTGVPEHPTVTGTFHIYQKYIKTRMKGDGYDLADVPWTMYFFEGYGLHGTYWHSNFGHPMSHGCVNMKTDEAKWLYDWAPEGTTVTVHP